MWVLTVFLSCLFIDWNFYLWFIFYFIVDYYIPLPRLLINVDENCEFFWSNVAEDSFLLKCCDAYWYFDPSVSWHHILLICKSQMILNYFVVGFECWRWGHCSVSKCWCLITSCCYILSQMSRKPANEDGWKYQYHPFFTFMCLHFVLFHWLLWLCGIVWMCVCSFARVCMRAWIHVCMWNTYVCKEKILFDLLVMREWELEGSNHGPILNAVCHYVSRITKPHKSVVSVTNS